MFTLADVKLAYRKLKRHVYYDKFDLHLRSDLASFECSDHFEDQLSKVLKVINSSDPSRNAQFLNWLNSIKFRLVPKSVNHSFHSQDETACDGKYHTNVTTANTLDIDKVNYFFHGPIELHLIAVIWIMKEGKYLDGQLGNECYGSRLDYKLTVDDDRSPHLFRRYHELYSAWRDTGIRKAKQLLSEERTNVCILGLDIQEYYYHINLDFNDIASTVNNEIQSTSDDEKTLQPSKLLGCIESIHSYYRRAIAGRLKLTHPMLSQANGIPIGLCSSPLLANWYLKSFDSAIKKRVRPAYYGRYVDDILIVVPMSEDPAINGKPVDTFIQSILVESKVLRPLKNGKYEFVNPGGLVLQQSKCILQYFDAQHSIAGLEKFQKKLEESGSDFMLLPVDEVDNSLEEVAYELLYEGSINKFRSVKGLSENRYELAKHLAKQSILHLLTDDPPNPGINYGLQKFFRGKNAIEFYDLWERVFTFFLIAGDQKAANVFAKHLRKQISLIKFNKHSPNSVIAELLKDNLTDHLEFSRAMADALYEDISPKNDRISDRFRCANLLRHYFVRFPLLNFTNSRESLLTRTPDEDIELSPAKISHSPRNIGFDEFLLLAYSGLVNIGGKSPFKWARNEFEKANGYVINQINWIKG